MEAGELKALLKQADYWAWHFSRLHPELEREELLGAAHLGLARGLQAWNPSRPQSRRSYVILRIHGEVQDWIRKTGYIARPLGNKKWRYNVAAAALEQAHGRPATESEIAAALEIPLETLHDWQRHWYPWADQSAVEEPAVAPDAAVLAGELLALLPERHRMIIQKLYLEDRSNIDLAAELGCSGARIAQLHQEALQLLRRPVALPSIGSDE